MGVTSSMLALDHSYYRSIKITDALSARDKFTDLLANIDSSFLKVRSTSINSSENEMLYCAKSLMLQGFYMEVANMVEVEESLSILSNFMEADAYQ